MSFLCLIKEEQCDVSKPLSYGWKLLVVVFQMNYYNSLGSSDIISFLHSESSSLLAILPGGLGMLLVPVLLLRVYIYLRTAIARRRR